MNIYLIIQTGFASIHTVPLICDSFQEWTSKWNPNVTVGRSL